jgi:hypothetical protein
MTLHYAITGEPLPVQDRRARLSIPPAGFRPLVIDRTGP